MIRQATYDDFMLTSTSPPNDLSGWWFDTEINQLYTKKITDQFQYDSSSSFTKQQQWSKFIEDVNIEQEMSEIETQEINNNTSRMINKMLSFRRFLDKLEIKFNKNRPLYTTYIRFEVGHLVVDNTSKEWNENTLVSFKHKQNGTGQGNTFELEIAFQPRERIGWKINEIESALLTAASITPPDPVSETLVTNQLKDRKLLFRDCTFIYGYGDDPELRSQRYIGKILEYQSKIDNGIFKYTIKGYSGIYSLKELLFSSKDEYLTGKEGTEETTNPLIYLMNIVDVELDPYYKLKFLDSIEPDNINLEINFESFQQKNIFQIFDDVLNGLQTKEEEFEFNDVDKKIAPTTKNLFGYYISPDVEKDNEEQIGTIYVYKFANAYDSISKLKPDCNIGFNWFAPRTSGGYDFLIKEWNPQFEGKALISLAFILQHNEGWFTTMNDEGEIINVRGLGAQRIGQPDDKTLQTTIQEQASWAYITQYPYKASMTIVGVPCETPVMGKIQITPTIYDQIHHSAGLYQILDKEDTINSSGFWSKFELVKIVKGYQPGESTSDSNSNDLTTNNVSQSTSAKKFQSPEFLYGEDYMPGHNQRQTPEFLYGNEQSTNTNTNTNTNTTPMGPQLPPNYSNILREINRPGENVSGQREI